VKDLKKEVITLSPEEQKKWIAKVQPVIDEYVTKTTQNKLPGKQFLDDLRPHISPW
jgi:polyhydroxyalkanoate synthesis regulator phasin